jgi:hypothetical protein
MQGLEKESARELVSFVRPEWPSEAQVCVFVCVRNVLVCACAARGTHPQIPASSCGWFPVQLSTAAPLISGLLISGR